MKMQLKDTKKMYIETVEVLLAGNGKSLVQEVLDGDPVTDVNFEKGSSLPLTKKYCENLSKFQGLPLVNVDEGDV